MNHLQNFLAIINRAALQKQLYTKVRNTNYIRVCLKKLISLGFIRGFVIRDSRTLIVYFKYDENNNCAIRNIQCVSRPGKRVYVRYKHFNKTNTLINTNVNNGAILSTSLGLLTSREALLKKVGGELLFIIV